MSKVKELAKRLSMNPQDAEVAVELVRQCVRNGLFKFKEIGELKGYKIKRIKQQDYLGIGDYFTGQGKTFKKKSKAIERAFDLISRTSSCHVDNFELVELVLIENSEDFSEEYKRGKRKEIEREIKEAKEKLKRLEGKLEE